jgi:hypothetical protein
MAGMIQIDVDELRPVSLIARERTGRRPSYSTIWRWRVRGVNGARLECVRAGGVWYTTPAAFAEFLRQQTANASQAARAHAPIDADTVAGRGPAGGPPSSGRPP